MCKVCTYCGGSCSSSSPTDCRVPRAGPSEKSLSIPCATAHALLRRPSERGGIDGRLYTRSHGVRSRAVLRGWGTARRGGCGSTRAADALLPGRVRKSRASARDSAPTSTAAARSSPSTRAPSRADASHPRFRPSARTAARVSIGRALTLQSAEAHLHDRPTCPWTTSIPDSPRRTCSKRPPTRPSSSSTVRASAGRPRWRTSPAASADPPEPGAT